MRDTTEEEVTARPPLADLTNRQLRERVRQQAAVASLGQFALSGAVLQRIFDEAVGTLADTLGVEYVKVLELLPDGRELLLKAGAGWRQGLAGHATVGAGLDSQAGYTLVSNGPVIVEDLRTESRFNGPPLLLEHGVVSGMSTIIPGRRGKPYGVLSTHTASKRVFTQDDVHFLQAVTNIVAISIERWEGQRELALYREVFTNSTDGIAIIGLDGHYLEQNEAHRQLTGYSLADLAGRTPEVHLGAETFAKVKEGLEREGQFQGEVISTTKDGEKREMELSAFAVRDHAGEPAYFVGIKRDVTARKRGLRLLARSEARHRQLVEAAPLAIGVHREQKLIFANAAAARLVGAKSPEDLIGRAVFDFVHPDYREELLRATRESRAAGTPTQASRVKLLALDGRVLDVEMVSIPLEDQDGPATQVLVRDITAQHLAEERLRFLVDAGGALNASLDYEQTLQEVARLAATSLADWAAVDVLQPDGTVRRLAVEHRDPRKVERVFEIMRRYPPDESGGVYQVMRTGEALFVPDVTDEMLAAAARDEEHLRLIRDLGLRSVVIAPLQARGRVLGALTFATAKSGRLLTPEDLDLANEIAARGALAIDNARLYQEAEQQRSTAQESSERLRFILGSARVGTWDWDIASGRVRWSDTMEEIRGLAPGSFGGTLQSFLEGVHPGDRDRVRQQTQEAIDSSNGNDASYEIEYRITHPTGLRWLAARGTVSRDETGRAMRLVGIATDVTHRREAEDALRAEERRLAMLVEVSPVGVIIWEPATDRMLLANREASRLTRADIRPGDRLADLAEGLVFKGEDGGILSRDQLPASRAALSGERTRTERITVVFPDGRTQHVLMSAAPFPDEEAVAASVVLLIQDITSLMETERLRNEFLGMVTHEMRSPLVVIKSATAIAKEDTLVATTETPELLNVIDEQADRMLGLVTNLLDMAQIEAGAFSVQPHPADLREVLETAVTHLEKVSSVPVKLRLPAGLPAMRLDAFRIGQVMNNLLSNAARFAEPGSAVRVEVELKPNAIVVAVRNNGPVITPDKIPLLFKKFTRINAGDGRRASGTGLGLSICKGIIEAHKGTIWAESIEASKETSFCFRLPLEGDERDRDERGTGEDTPVPSQPRAGERRFRILAVDDEPVVLRYVQNLLRHSGYEVAAVANAVDTANKVLEFMPDLVLLDLMMPEMSGFEVLENIRAFSDVPVIFLSASDRDEDKARGLTLGADDYISKPFSTTELAARITAVLRRHPGEDR